MCLLCQYNVYLDKDLGYNVAVVHDRILFHGLYTVLSSSVAVLTGFLAPPCVVVKYFVTITSPLSVPRAPNSPSAGVLVK